MTIPAFSPSEYEVIGSYPVFETISQVAAAMGRPPLKGDPKRNTPITPKENMRMLLEGDKACWLPNYSVMCNSEVIQFRPRQILDNYATYNVFDGGGAVDYEGLVIRGWFDLDWEFAPVAGGSTVHPGAPKIDDMND